PLFRSTFARLVTHFWSNAAFRGPTELLDRVAAISHLPAAFLHGRHDISSPLAIPWQLHRNWPGSTLTVVDAGHGTGMDAEVRAAVDAMPDQRG
ncbi:MAG TPA: prolyl aminopeptidase, partial [Naasia sp.]